MTSTAHRQAENSLDKKDWQTPPIVFNALHEQLRFTMDVAANAANALCPDFLSEERDAFTHPWGVRSFCNPPYGRYGGRSLLDWHKRAKQQTVEGVCELAGLLVPANTDTKAFHFGLRNASGILLVEGRIRFIGPGDSPPGANAFVIYRKGVDGPARVVSWPNPQDESL